MSHFASGFILSPSATFRVAGLTSWVKVEHPTAGGGTSIKDLMARMGHDSERAALIYQHQARGADKIITDSIDSSDHRGIWPVRGPRTYLLLGGGSAAFSCVAGKLTRRMVRVWSASTGHPIIGHGGLRSRS